MQMDSSLIFNLPTVPLSPLAAPTMNNVATSMSLEAALRREVDHFRRLQATGTDSPGAWDTPWNPELEYRLQLALTAYETVSNSEAACDIFFYEHTHSRAAGAVDRGRYPRRRLRIVNPPAGAFRMWLPGLSDRLQSRVSDHDIKSNDPKTSVPADLNGSYRIAFLLVRRTLMNLRFLQTRADRKHVQFGLRVHVVVYAEDTTACWVMLAVVDGIA